MEKNTMDLKGKKIKISIKKKFKSGNYYFRVRSIKGINIIEINSDKETVYEFE